MLKLEIRLTMTICCIATGRTQRKMIASRRRRKHIRYIVFVVSLFINLAMLNFNIVF
jgi:hypothetical protein